MEFPWLSKNANKRYTFYAIYVDDSQENKSNFPSSNAMLVDDLLGTLTGYSINDILFTDYLKYYGCKTRI